MRNKFGTDQILCGKKYHHPHGHHINEYNILLSIDFFRYIIKHSQQIFCTLHIHFEEII